MAECTRVDMDCSLQKFTHKFTAVHSNENLPKLMEKPQLNCDLES